MKRIKVTQIGQIYDYIENSVNFVSSIDYRVLRGRGDRTITGVESRYPLVTK